MASRSLSTTGCAIGSLGLSTDGILFSSGGLALTSISLDTVPDDGGFEITVYGVLPTTQGFYISIVDTSYTPDRFRRCNFGEPGTKELIVSTDGGSAKVWVPPMAIGGPYDVHAITEDEVFESTLAAVITYVHRDFTTDLYSLRSAWPPPRDVGAYRLEDED